MSADATAVRPFAKPLRHPLRFVGQKLVMAGWGVILTYCGVLAVAAFYYIFTQKIAPVHDEWHKLVSNGDLRHNIRDVGEGLFGGLMAKQFVWNHYKKPGLFDRLFAPIFRFIHWPTPGDGREMKWWQAFPLLQILILVFAAPGFYLMWRASIGISDLLAHHKHTLAAFNFHDSGSAVLHKHWSVLHKSEDTITHNWPKRLIGFGSAFFWGIYPAKGVFDDLQLVACRWMVAHGYRPPRLMPAPFKARYETVCALGIERAADRQNRKLAVVFGATATVIVALAGYGWYVMTYIAPH